jgi:hypothetical protein
MRPVPASPETLRPLRPFARSGDGPVRALLASAGRDGDAALRLRYVLDADPGALRIPGPRSPGRADELWKHTCFEAFVASQNADEDAVARAARGGGYIELNFSPSTEWAAYAFESYRKGMTPVPLPCAPRIEVTRSGSQLIVEARIEASALFPESGRASGAKLRIALSAVIEDESGRISYWALKHAPDKPDFHHAAGFILEV